MRQIAILAALLSVLALLMFTARALITAPVAKPRAPEWSCPAGTVLLYGWQTQTPVCVTGSAATRQ